MLAPTQYSLHKNYPDMKCNAYTQLSMGMSTEQDDGYSIYVDDESDVSTLTCSITEASVCNMKRSRKSMHLSSIDLNQDSRAKKRRRGVSYTVVEIHSLLHLMKRVLPKSADEWELIRMVHSRIFPTNDRTVVSLKKKFRELCRDNEGQHLLDDRFRAQPVHGEKEVEKAREVQHMISLKPPGYQLILPNNTKNQKDVHNTNLKFLPMFQVKVPNPLEPVVVTQQVNELGNEVVPKIIQIPESPVLQSDFEPSPEDDMSDLDIDNDDDEESVIACPITPRATTENVTRVIDITPCFDATIGKKSPAIVSDQK